MSTAGPKPGEQPAAGLAPDASDATPQVTPAEEHYAVAAIKAAVPGAVQAVKFALNETTITVAPEAIVAVGEAVKAAGYIFLEDVTATDWLPAEPRFHVVYHVLNHKRKERIRLKVLLDSGDPVVNTITPVWPSANFYEREVFDLFGIRFGGHPNMRRILMPDDWQGNPLRKDYPVEGYR